MKISTKSMTRIGLASSMLCVIVYAIPPLTLSVLPVPLTLQLLVVLVISSLLNRYEATASIIIYLIIGSLGLPVFSGGRGGLSILFGPTGGFLLSFPFISFLIASMRSRYSNWYQLLAWELVALYALMYPLASLWLSLYTVQSWIVVFSSLLPFMLVDLIKVAISIALYMRVRKNPVIQKLTQ